MKNLGPWNSDDFETMSWHDVHVHGLRFTSFIEELGTADIALDLDYILEWDGSGDQMLFTICRAELVFHDIFGLKLELNYATPTSGMCPFAIDTIKRELVSYPTGSKTFRWRIDVNWPQGSIEFDATSFTQRLTGRPIVKAGIQSLSPAERSAA
jgi:hypothetical protein